MAALGILVDAAESEDDLLDLAAVKLGLEVDAEDDEILAALAVEEEAGDPPEGSINTVAEWIGESRFRALRAYDAELSRDTPRKTLLKVLDAFLAEPGGDGADDDAEGQEQAVRPSYDPFRGYPAR